jgi:hypothetical protein
VVSVVAGLFVGLLALSWLVPTLYIGLAEPVFFVILGVYSLALWLDAYKLVRSSPRASLWSILGVVLVLLPVGFSVALGIVSPQPAPDPAEPHNDALLLVPFGVAALTAVAFALNWRHERQANL